MKACLRGLAVAFWLFVLFGMLACNEDSSSDDDDDTASDGDGVVGDDDDDLSPTDGDTPDDGDDDDDVTEDDDDDDVTEDGDDDPTDGDDDPTDGDDDPTDGDDDPTDGDDDPTDGDDEPTDGDGDPTDGDDDPTDGDNDPTDGDGDLTDGDEEVCDGCLIGETCIPTGQEHPESACALCDPERDVNGWSPKPLDTECRGSVGVCDVAEVCDGVSNDCPADEKATTECRAVAGVCDVAEACDGVSNDCPADEKATTECRAVAGVCDVAEVCDGMSNDCPADEKATTECRGSAGVCDVAEVCDGVSNDCPEDEKATTECRAVAGVCDVAEVCDGMSNDCPADEKATTECRGSAGVCDVAEVCDGVSNDCPEDEKATTECRAVAGVCDVAEACDGVSNDCPADEKATTECRGSAGVCDVAEACDGVSNDCPADEKATSGTACNDTNQCDGEGNCLDCTDASGCGDLAYGERAEACTERVCGADNLCAFNDAPTGTGCGSDDQCEDGICADCTDSSGCEDFADDGKPCTDKACDNHACGNVNDDMNACDLGYACTNDHCSDGECLVETITTGCLIGSVCVDEGASQDADGCIACDPAASQTAWTNMNGAACAVTDDGNPCTDKVCAEGACIVQNDNNNTCADEIGCTNTTCSGGSCVVSGTSAGCYIDNACYEQNARKAATGNDSCRVCNQATTWNAWTTLTSGTCNDGNACTYNDACTLGGSCAGTINTCSDRGTCNPTDGLCTCDNANMNEDCSACLPHFIGYPDCEWDGTFPEGYCEYNACTPAAPTGVSLCHNETESIACPTGVPASCNQSAPEDFCGQDAQYVGHARAFTCYHADGSVQVPCAATTSHGETVGDTLSGLRWQRHLPTLYDGCTLGSPAGSRCSWQEAVDYCENLEIGERRDWRAPSPHELAGISDLSRYQPTIDTGIFPMETVNQWTSLTYAAYEGRAWSVSYYNGITQAPNKTDALKVRCVHGGKATTGSSGFNRFETDASSDQTVVHDLVSGLSWQGVDTTSKTWKQAMSYCEGLDYAGYEDWRLPDANEMQTLVDYSRAEPASSFPVATLANYWLSTTLPFLDTHAYALSFQFGASMSWAKTGTMSVRCVRDRYRLTPGFVPIRAGSFWMGSPDGTCPEGYPGSCTSELGRYSDRETLHYVQLTYDFELSRYEITEAEFEGLMGWNPMDTYDSDCTYGCGDDHPMKYLSWYDTLAYANQLSLGAGLTPCYVLSNVGCEDGGSAGTDYMNCFDGDATYGGIDSATVTLTGGVTKPQECEGYRLPTEAEWEYAIRAGSNTAFYPSDGNKGTITNILCSDPNMNQIGWYCGNNTPSRTKPVGGKEANAWGLYDMSGNLWEWTWDWYAGSYPAGTVASPLVDPTGAVSGSERVYRGGGCFNAARLCRSALRFAVSPADRGYLLGFRLARSSP